MTDGVPTLEVGFAIEPDYSELARLQSAMDSTEAQIVADAASIERATGNMLNLGNATAAIKSFGNSTTREFQSITRERAAAEKAGEALVRQLTREASTFGLTKAEIRANKVETAALAAEKAGLTELAGRLREQEAGLVAAQNAATAAANREAQAIREAAQAHQMFEAAARRGMATLRQQEVAEAAAAQEAQRYQQQLDALRGEIDPLAAAQTRLNQQLDFAAEALRRGDISAAQYQTRAAQLNASMSETATVSGAARAGMANLGFQIQDIFQGIAMGVNPFTILAQQGGQLAGALSDIFSAAQPAAGAVAGAAGSVTGLNTATSSAKSSTIQLTAAATAETGALGGVAAAATGAAGATTQLTIASRIATFAAGPLGAAAIALVSVLGMFAFSSRDGAEAANELTGASNNLGAAQSALGQMFDLSTGKIINNTQAIRDNLVAQSMAMQQQAIIDRREADKALEEGGIGRTSAWSRFGTRLMAFATQNPARIAAAEQNLARQEGQGRKFEALVEAVAAGMPLEMARGELERRRAGLSNDELFGVQKALTKAYDSFTAGVAARQMDRGLGGDLDRSLIKPDTDKPDKPKIDRHAESLIRDAEAVEAQIKNLYALAAAYDVSGAAALVAEARVKAESDAIKKRGDVDAMVNRQVQVAIAQRVADAAKGNASMREQVRVQEEVNARVVAGNVPAERAAQLVEDRLADLPLLQAAEAAQQRGLADEAQKAMKALADQQAVREDMRKAEEEARFNSSMAEGADRLELLREELRLVGATNEERTRALALIKATQDAEQFTDPAKREAWIKQQLAITDTEIAIDRATEAIRRQREEFDYLVGSAVAAGDAISRAFGRVGDAVGDAISVIAEYQSRQKDIDDRVVAGTMEAAEARKRSTDLQLQGMTSLFGASKNLFKEHSAGYRAMAAAEKAFALVQLANTAVNVAAGAAKMFAMLGPWAFPAVAAMIGVMASLGFASSGKSDGPAPTNEGTGTVLGDSAAKSESITRAINQLREVDTLMLGYSRQMAGSLRTIEDNIAGFASLLVRNAEGLNASTGVAEGFKSNAGTTLAGIGMILGGPIGAGIGALLTKIPIVGSILKGLFGTKTTVVGSGLYGGAQSLGDILAGGFDAQVYSDIKKKKKFFGISAGTSYSTQYGNADPMLENQFTLILKSFNDAILAAAGPLGLATTEIQQRLNGFVLNIGKIDLQGLTGEQIEEKLTAIFGAAADSMAQAAFPGIDRFQKVGEGLFETLVRVASTVEAVTASLDMLGQSTTGLTVDIKVALADQFDSVSDFTDAIGNYFSAYYTKEEQTAARLGQMTDVFASLGLTLPSSLAAFRALVEAQDLNTAAGRAAYATLLQLAPAFADLQAAMAGAKTAADIASERQDLERQMLELRGDTAALRALQLAKLDASNRGLQLEIWAMQDAQAAAKAADELRKAWQGVSDSIMDEVRRIRGLTAEGEAGAYAALLARFNEATATARGGDIEAGKLLPQLSQQLLAAAADSATSRAELDRIRAMIAASLELTNSLIAPTPSNTALLDAAAASQSGGGAATDAAANNTTASVDELRAETVNLRADLTAALATIAANTARTARKLEDVTAQSGGDAISTVPAA